MPPNPVNHADGADETVELLARAKAGDRDALDTLFARHIPTLRRWARGRLPRWARDISDTSDIVQDSVFQTFKRIESFEPRGEGALQAYLRQALVNHLRNQLRRVGARPQTAALDSATPADAASPLEVAIGRQTLERYDAALGRLSLDDRDAIVSRIEFGMSYSEIAAAMNKPTPDAARQTVVRALKRLMDEMS
jgi:RNA polymerase sigma-70 factor (ECF subfamily)